MRDKMRILVTTETRHNPMWVSLLKALKELGHEPIFITYGDEPPAGDQNAAYEGELLKRESIEYFHIPAFVTARNLPLLRMKVPRLFKRIEVDASLSGEFFWPSTALFRLLSTNNFLSYTYENKVTMFPPAFWRAMTTFANKLYKAVMVPLRSTEECWRPYGLEKIFINPLGVDVKLFSYSKNEISSELKILYVGRVAPEKGIDYLLSATNLLEVPYSLTIAGDGNLAYYLKLTTQLKCNANFLGPIAYPELPKLYREHNVLVLPSITTRKWKEQFGFVIVEAMASGRVVVGSDSGSIPEVVGDAGLIVPERSSKALAEALNRLYESDHLVQFKSKRARRRAEDLFNIKRNVECLVDLFYD